MERVGLIDLFTDKILDQAFEMASRYLPAPLFLSVNISPIQMLGSTLPESIWRLAKQRDFGLDRLIVEITESALLDDLERAVQTATELKALGVRLAIDDFGVGYSCLAHLKSIPFDEIKIDRSFVASMGKDREGRKIVAAIVGLGYSLGLVTIGEGIEHKEQAAMLIRMGCERGQGWLYGRPVPAVGLPLTIVSMASQAITGGAVCRDNENLCNILDSLPAQRLSELQAIYDGAPVGLCFVDSNLRFVSINKHLAEIDDLSVAEHLGRKVSEVTPDIYAQFEPYLLRALKGEAVHNLEIQESNAADDRQNRTFLAFYHPAHDEDGGVVGVSVAVIDITERKLAEQTRRQSELMLKPTLVESSG
jgi:PAS domain S-box-containing protein